MSKSLGLSNNYSNTADAIEYRTDGKVIALANKNPVGALTLDQMSRGFTSSNVQSAIDDLSSMSFMDVGGIQINTTGTSPAGVQQTTRATFSGVDAIQDPLSDVLPTSSTTRIVNILGMNVTLDQGETADHVATKFADALQVYSTNGVAVDTVQQNTTTPTIVDFRHLDYYNHYFDTIYVNGITVTFTILSPAKYGYGDWFKIGQEDKTFGDSSSTVTFHYYQRLS